MADTNLIATLIPVDQRGLAERAFSHDNNKPRRLSPTRTFNDDPTIGSREPTPARALSPQDNADHEGSHRILLKFDQPPKDPGKGYAFGTNKEKCDVMLGSRGVRGTSSVHFHISFDVINKKRRLVLRDSSTNGSAVSYNGQAKDEVRHNFTWILNLDKTNAQGEITGIGREIQVHVRGLEFKVELATHGTSKIKYDEMVMDFLEHSRTADPPLSGLNINSYMTEVAPSQSRTPGQRPVYLQEGKLGKGSFGHVDRVVDASTGAIYARKSFFEPLWGKNNSQRKCQKDEWLMKIRREIRIMMDHPHEHIIPILDFQEDPKPFFMMPYLPLGTLRDESERKPLDEADAVDLTFQILTVLEYLHSRGVAYRDLKPENILVESRSPLYLRVADFGFANDQPDLNTFCGTEIYAAPEIFTGGKYTSAVDIWSLGVIVLEYVYGHPPQHWQTRTGGDAALKERGLAWCHRLVEHVNDWDSDPLIDLLTSGMLRMEAPERLSTSACLAKGYELGVFTRSGETNPTQSTARANALIGKLDGEEAPSMIVGPLWDAGRAYQNTFEDDQQDDEEDQVGQNPPERYSATLTSHQPVSPEDGHVPAKRRRTISDPSPFDPTDSLSNDPDHELSLEQDNSAKRHLYWRKVDFSPLKSSKETVFLRKVDSWINASQLLKIAGYRRSRHPFIWKSQTFEYELVVGAGDRQGIYVPIEVGVEICKRYGLDEWANFLNVTFQPKRRSVHIHTKSSQQDNFVFIQYKDKAVAVRKTDGKVNMSHICSAARLHNQNITDWKRRYKLTVDVVRGGKVAGSYVSFSEAIKLGQSLKLSLIVEILNRLKSAFTQEDCGGESTEDNARSLLNQRSTATAVSQPSQILLPSDHTDNNNTFPGILEPSARLEQSSVRSPTASQCKTVDDTGSDVSNSLGVTYPSSLWGQVLPHEEGGG